MRRQFTHLNFIGGGANSDVWSQILADVLERPIRQVAGPIYANGRGAAFLAAIALRYIKVEEIPDLIEIKAEYKPNPDISKIYREIFSEFINLYNVHKKICSRINKKNRPNVCVPPQQLS